MLFFLDLSLAFDTMNHQVLLSRLSDRFGIKGSALSWFVLIFRGVRSLCVSTTQHLSVVRWCLESLKVPLLHRFCAWCRLLRLAIYNESIVYVFTCTPTPSICTRHLSHLLLVISSAPVQLWSHVYVLLSHGCFIITLKSLFTLSRPAPPGSRSYRHIWQPHEVWWTY